MKTQESTTVANEAKTSTKKARGAKATGKANAKVATPKRAAKTSKAAGLPATKAARPDSKKAIVLEPLRRKHGATLMEISKATDWQNHSIRGFVSGQVTKKLGLTVDSTKSEAGDRAYRLVG